MNLKGFSLLETVIYIGLLSLLLSSTVVFSLGLLQKVDVIDSRVRMEEKAALVLNELSNEITQAQSINITGSTLGVDGSSLVFVDATGVSVTIDRTTDSVDFPGGAQTVNRLRIQRGVTADWLTDGDISVESWNVQAVRNSASTLTGLNIELNLDLMNDDGSPFRQAEFDASTTISLNGQTSEL
ncbi:MAG: hypothetical protein HQ488_03095 [Parcubacteria group bacterium]|nr:hypothetical protein [Parcubacteria group bacterium]